MYIHLYCHHIQTMQPIKWRRRKKSLPVTIKRKNGQTKKCQTEEEIGRFGVSLQNVLHRFFSYIIFYVIHFELHINWNSFIFCGEYNNIYARQSEWVRKWRRKKDMKESNFHILFSFSFSFSLLSSFYNRFWGFNGTKKMWSNMYVFFHRIPRINIRFHCRDDVTIFPWFSFFFHSIGDHQTSLIRLSNVHSDVNWRKTCKQFDIRIYWISRSTAKTTTAKQFWVIYLF